MADLARFRMLISYHYFQRQNIDEMLAKYFPDGDPEVFADSGAFSAKTQGAPVDVHEYAGWLKRFESRFFTYSNLDVIGDGAEAAEGTWVNQRILEDEHGLKPIPVFHAGEPWEALERYLEAGYPYIALGGLVGRPVASIMAWLVRAFRMAEGTAVFHGFGLTSWEPILALPWFSIDSSSWGSGYRFGFLRLFDPGTCREVRVQMFDPKDVYLKAKLIRRLGGDPACFATRENYDRRHACYVAATSWREAEAFLRRRHGEVSMPEGTAVGLRWYCADSQVQNLSYYDKGLRLYLADTNMRDLAAGAGQEAPAQ